jgi:hypothetical protein
MEKFKGTKGPWELGGCSGRMIKPKNEQNYGFIADVDTKDNAKLIAAAPELLEALEIYLNAGSKDQRKEASIIAKKAINKALN